MSGDLAILGGTPAFSSPVHVGRPNLPPSGEILEALGRILARNHLTNDGPEVRRLEEQFRQLTGTRHAIAMCNATVALQVLARALDLRGRVLMPAFTFVATAHAFAWLGLEPAFCDVDPVTHNLDPREVRQQLARGNVAAVVGVHLWGRLCAPLELEAVCAEFGVPLIFDAAHATGCRGHGRAAGAFGTAEVFSLHATKVVHSFEGGVVTTNDAALALRLQRMRNFGFTGYDHVDGLGINAKMAEISGAMGCLSLAEFDRYRAANRERHDWYREHLQGIAGLRLLDAAPDTTSNHHYVVAEFSAPWPDDTRDLVYQALHAEGILARRYFYPGVHRMEPYRQNGHAPLPATEMICRRVLCFPNGLAIDQASVVLICARTRRILDSLPAVRARVQSAAGS